MNKTFLGLALVILIAAGAGFWAFSGMSGSEDKSVNATAENTADTANKEEATAAATQAADEVAASTEPAADGQESADKDNPVLAIVEGQKITQSDVMDTLKNLPPQMQHLPAKTLYPMVLEQLVNTKVIDAKLAKADMADNAEVARRMKDAQEQIERAVFVEGQIDKAYDQAETKKAYDEMVSKMPKVDEVRASHILVKEEKTAKEIIKKLEDGADFADLAKQYSEDKSNAGNGGDLGYFAKGDMVKSFGDAAFSMKKGEYTKEPVKTQFGYHVILVQDKRVRPAPTFKDVEPQLEAQEKRQILNDMVEKWRKDADVKLFDMDGNPLPKADEAKDAKADQ